MTTVYLAGPSPLFLAGVEMALSQEPNLLIQRLCSNVNELVAQLQQQPPPQVLLLDLSHHRVDGPAICEAIRARFPSLPVLVFYHGASLQTIKRFIKRGIKGCVQPQLAPKVLPEAVRQIASGQVYIDPALRKQLTNESLGINASQRRPVSLTPRERQVLQLIVEEFTTKEIAQKLFISNCTVETHRINIIQKLGVKNTAGMVREAMRRDLYV